MYLKLKKLAHLRFENKLLLESVEQSAHSIECVDEAVDTQLKAAIICLCTSREKQCMQRITKQNIFFFFGVGWGWKLAEFIERFFFLNAVAKFEPSGRRWLVRERTEEKKKKQPKEVLVCGASEASSAHDSCRVLQHVNRRAARHGQTNRVKRGPFCITTRSTGYEGFLLSLI